MTLLDQPQAKPRASSGHVTVSAIVPVYNVLPYLRQCLDSLLQQNLEGLEIILVDDGSTDGSSELVDSYAARHASIRAFRKPNGGLSDARNYGLARARGEYVAFIDSDDWLEDGALDKLYRRAIDTGAEVVACGGFRHLARTGRTIRWGRRGPADTRFGVPVSQSPWILFASQSYAWNKIFHRRLFAELGHRFPVGRWFEDSAVIYNVMADANKVEFVDEHLYHYRYGRDGAITSAATRKTFDIFHACRDFLSFLEAKQIDHPDMPAVLETLACGHILFRFDNLLDSDARPLVRDFIREAFAFLDQRFPGWKGRYKLTRGQRFSWKARARKSKFLALSYLYLPSRVKKLVDTPPRSPLSRILAMLREKRTLRRQREALRLNGPEVLRELHGIMSGLRINYFADFGTLLGFVRDGGFMAHDTDLDLGVIVESDAQIDRLREALQERGCTLWRSYSYDGTTAEESYYFPYEAPHPKLKFDINYYRSDGDTSYTYLFYREPGEDYLDSERSVVKMVYSLIRGTTKIERLGLKIPVPLDAERLLAEKYGPNWRIPDPGWIYWQSPAAKKMPERSFFKPAWHCNSSTSLCFDPTNMAAWGTQRPSLTSEGAAAMAFRRGETYELAAPLLRARKNLIVIELPQAIHGRQPETVTLHTEAGLLKFRPHPTNKEYLFAILPALEDAPPMSATSTRLRLTFESWGSPPLSSIPKVSAIYILAANGIFSRYCVNLYRKWKSRLLMRRLRWTIDDFPCSHIDGLTYLADYEDARSGVRSGRYATGAHHYFAVGRSLGRRCPLAVDRGSNVGTRSDLIAWERDRQA
jgi:glycosyltransferase involved in cell wall biosynthesis